MFPHVFVLPNLEALTGLSIRLATKDNVICFPDHRPPFLGTFPHQTMIVPSFNTTLKKMFRVYPYCELDSPPDTLIISHNFIMEESLCLTLKEHLAPLKG